MAIAKVLGLSDFNTGFKSLAFMGYPRYRVGADGSVWSKCKVGKTSLTAGLSDKWKLRKLTVAKNGYRVLPLSNEHGPKLFYVHRLVLSAFRGECPEGFEACHNDGNPLNNVLENLRWGTPSSNQQDAVRHGRKVNQPKCESHRHSKLTTAQVRNIRKLRKADKKKYTYNILSKLFGVSDCTIGSIVTRKGWKSL